MSGPMLLISPGLGAGVPGKPDFGLLGWVSPW